MQLKGGSNAIFAVGPGLVSALVQRGYDVRLPIYDEAWGSFRKAHADERVDGTLLVLEGKRAGTPVKGFRLLGTYDSRRHPGDLSDANTGLASPVERIALYLSPVAITRPDV